ncbi:hypothetical protein A9970_11320 [Sphingobacterium sp. UME9]|nr:hypothetical protein [Sphingobacterium sp. UME9]
MCIASLGFNGLLIRGKGISHDGTGNGQRTRNDPLLPIRISCRSYSRQSVRTGLLPANALSAYWYRQVLAYLTFAKFPVPRRIMLHSSMSKTVHAPLSQRMRLPVSCGQVGDLIARSRNGFEFRSVKKDLGSVGRLLFLGRLHFLAALPVPCTSFFPMGLLSHSGTKHENGLTQKQCKGVKETFHPCAKKRI